jgi:hypothetical protein
MAHRKAIAVVAAVPAVAAAGAIGLSIVAKAEPRTDKLLALIRQYEISRNPNQRRRFA